MMLKGPAAMVLLVGTTLLFAAWSKSWHRLKALRPVAGIALAGAIAGSWYVVAATRDPAYVRELLYLHNFERFRSGTPGHPQNPFYYLYVLPAVFLPWSLWWPPVAAALWHDPRSRDRAVRFCLCWAVAVVGFFSLSRGKLPTYVLPAFPPLAVLTALGLEALSRGSAGARWIGRWAYGSRISITVVVLVALVAGVPLLWWLGEPELAKALFLCAAAGAGVLGLTTWRMCLPERVSGTMTTVVAATTVALIVFYCAAGPVIGRRYSLRDAAWTIQSWAPTAEIVSFHAGDHSLLFYLGKPVRRVRTAAEAAAALREGRPVVLLAKQRALPEICAAVGAPLVVVWQGERDKLMLARPTWVAGPGNGPAGDLTCTDTVS